MTAWPATQRTTFYQRLFALWLASLLLACQPTGKPENSIELAVQGLYTAAFSADAEYALVGSINHGGSLWQVSNGERLYNWNHQAGEFSQITAAAIAPGSDFAMTTSPLTMVLWDSSTGQSVNYWNAPSEILDVDLLPGGTHAALALVDHTATLYDAKNGGVQRIYKHEGRVNSVDVHLNSNRLLTGSDDFRAILWNLDSGKAIHRWLMNEEVQLVKLSHDGKIALAMAKYGSATLWDTATGLKLGEIPLGSSALRRGKTLTAVAFSANSDLLLTGSPDSQIQLWRTSDMQMIKQWKTPKRHKASPVTPAVLALAFIADDHFYAITSDGFLHQLRR